MATKSTANCPLVLPLFELAGHGSTGKFWFVMAALTLYGLARKADFEDGRSQLSRPHPEGLRGQMGERQDLQSIAQSCRPLTCFQYCQNYSSLPCTFCI